MSRRKFKKGYPKPGCQLHRLDNRRNSSSRLHPDVGKQYFVKINLSASLVRSISPRSVMEFLLSFSIFSSPSKVCSTIVPSPSNDILRLCSSITTESGFLSFIYYTQELPGVST